jgi:tetratricopeptide (TPR) repeat protein
VGSEMCIKRQDSPLVGRGRELHLLTDAFDRAVADRAGQLVTMLGAAGVGKSRLVQEFRNRIDGRATFLVGRCLSYGEGITYWPLADALRAVIAVDDDKPVESWRQGLVALMAGQPQAEAIVDQVVGLIGVGEAGGGTDAFWAVRRLLEGLARRRPLVLAVDDLHWATPTFLDLVEHVADWTRDAPILLVCLARPELIDARPGWAGGKMNATTFLLEPLDEASIDQHLAHLLGKDAAATSLPRRIASAAEGNPLFVEELVAMLVERGELVDEADGALLQAEPSELAVPPTIEALMAARLDQLAPTERDVLERASVIGKQFGVGEVARLSDDAGAVSIRATLMAMVRRDLLRPDPEVTLPLGDDDEAFRFRHQLIRDAAYAGMSKAERSRLHERYASLLEELPPERLGQLDEVIGYHLEQAHVLRATLRREPDTASRAASHLRAAGVRAADRADFAAASNLLARAERLLPPADPQRIACLPPLANALSALGRFEEAQAAVSEAIGATETGSDPATRVRALCLRAELARTKGATAAEMRTDVEEALAIAEQTGDPTQLSRAHGALGGLALDAGRLREARRELELSVEAAYRAGDSQLEGAMRANLGLAVWMSLDPAGEIARILGESLAFAREHGRRGMESYMLAAEAVETARHGQLSEARRLVADSLAIADEIGAPVWSAAASRERGFLEFLADEPAARERVLREGYERLTAMGERGFLSTIAADLADALVDLGRLDEAGAMCDVAEAAGANDDVSTQVRVRLVRGRLAAARGKLDEALAFAADALALGDQGEYYDIRTLSRLVFAQLLLDAGRGSEAQARAQEVLDLARARGDVVFEAKAKDLLERAAVSRDTSG